MSRRILYVGLDPYHYQAQGEITHFPLIQIVPRALNDPLVYQALQLFSSYTHVIITSKSSIGILATYLAQLGFSMQEWQSKITCVVGKITALSLKQIGITPTIIAQEETAEGIVEALRSLNLEQSYLFWPHSSEARPVLKDFLNQMAICHQSCALYDPQTIPYSTLPSLDKFDEVMFTSPSTVKAFLTYFQTFPPHLKLTAIGPVTARYLKSLGGISQEFLPIS
jgi:uroporphyrinogen-III synthase